MLLRAAPSLPCVSVLSPSRSAPLVACPFTPPIEGERCDAVQVLTFHTKAWSSFAPPTCRMPPGPYQASPELIPGKGYPPVLTSPNPLSTLHRRFACARLSQPCLPESCPGVSATFTTIAFDDSSLRWLEVNT